jgi:hypothetical protein
MTVLQVKTRGVHGTDFNIQDKNDCAVRALANVSVLSYPEAHKQISEGGRRKNRGTPWGILHTVYTVNGGKPIYYGANMRRTAQKYTVPIQEKGMTLGTFLKENKRGSFIVIVRGHALAVCDGSIIDTIASKAGTRVRAVYKF